MVFTRLTNGQIFAREKTVTSTQEAYRGSGAHTGHFKTDRYGKISFVEVYASCEQGYRNVKGLLEKLESFGVDLLNITVSPHDADPRGRNITGKQYVELETDLHTCIKTLVRVKAAARRDAYQPPDPVQAAHDYYDHHITNSQ